MLVFFAGILIVLTNREKITYQYIIQYIREQGQSPLLSEIALGIGIRSKGVIHRYVARLTELGYISSGSGRHRGIRVLKRREPELADQPNRLTFPVPSNHSELPLLGRIAAGIPIEAIEGEDSIDMMAFLVGPDRFVLRVSGDSMQDAGILDGDMVVVKQSKTAQDNEIVVALIDMQDATLKFYRNHRDGTISLRPANSSMSVLRYTADRVTIQGVVVAQLRSYL